MNLGSLVVSLTASTAQFEKDMGRAAHEASKRMESISKSAERAANLIQAMFLAGIGSAALLVRNSLNVADAMYKMSQSAGIGIETLSELSYVAKLSGLDLESLSISIRALNRNIEDASHGQGDAARAFEALGIQAKDAAGNLKSADQVMAEVADRFAGMEDGAGKSALAMMLFGKSGAQMIPMLNQGSKGIQALRDEARAMGLTLDTETGRAAERFNDNLQKLGFVTQGFGNHLASIFVPTLNDLTQSMVNAAKAADAFELPIKAVVIAFQALVVTGANVAFVFQTIGAWIGNMAARFAAFARGDFASPGMLMREFKEESAKARAELDEFEAKIMAIGQASKQSGSWLSDMWDDAGKGLSKAPGIVTQKDIDEAKKRAQELRDIIRKVNEENDKRDIEQILRNNKAMEDAHAQSQVQAGSEIDASFERTAANMRAAADRAMGLEEVRKSLLSQEEIENEAHEKRMATLSVWTDAELEAVGGRQSVIERMEADHQDRLREIRIRGFKNINDFTKAGFRQQTATVLGEMANMTAGVAQSNRFLFEVNKLSTMANILLNIPETVSDAYKWGTKRGGPVLGAIMGGLALGAQLAQLNAARSAQFGGGAAPSLAGTTAAPPVSPVPPVADTQGSSRTTSIIQLHGDVFSREGVRSLIERINEEQKDGMRLIFV